MVLRAAMLASTSDSIAHTHTHSHTHTQSHTHTTTHTQPHTHNHTHIITHTHNHTQVVSAALEEASGGLKGWQLLSVGGALRGRASHDADFLVTHPAAPDHMLCTALGHTPVCIAVSEVLLKAGAYCVCRGGGGGGGWEVPVGMQLARV